VCQSLQTIALRMIMVGSAVQQRPPVAVGHDRTFPEERRCAACGISVRFGGEQQGQSDGYGTPSNWSRSSTSVGETSPSTRSPIWSSRPTVSTMPSSQASS
jgi:hypothetical protein